MVICSVTVYSQNGINNLRLIATTLSDWWIGLSTIHLLPVVHLWGRGGLPGFSLSPQTPAKLKYEKDIIMI
jgi:hypothetical protein